MNVVNSDRCAQPNAAVGPSFFSRVFTSSLPVARQQSLYLRESLERKEVQENKLRSRFKRALKANQEIAKVVDELRASKMISNKAAASLDMFEG